MTSFELNDRSAVFHSIKRGVGLNTLCVVCCICCVGVDFLILVLTSRGDAEKLVIEEWNDAFKDRQREMGRHNLYNGVSQS